MAVALEALEVAVADTSSRVGGVALAAVAEAAAMEAQSSTDEIVVPRQGHRVPAVAACIQHRSKTHKHGTCRKWFWSRRRTIPSRTRAL